MCVCGGGGGGVKSTNECNYFSHFVRNLPWKLHGRLGLAFRGLASKLTIFRSLARSRARAPAPANCC